MLRIAMILFAVVALAACGRNISSNTYMDSATSGKVLEGTVLSARAVTVKSHDKLANNSTGGLVGGAGGALAGSQIGSGTGKLGGILGGAVIGAVAGALVEDTLSTSDGMEYLVKLDSKYVKKTDSRNRKYTRRDIKNPSVDSDIVTSIDTDMQTDIISVVQSGEVFDEGSRVYVVYHNDRPRLVAAK